MALSLDGTPLAASAGGTSTAVTGTFTTSAGSGVIIAGCATNAASITSVTASGLTFTARKTLTPTNGPTVLAVYTAPYTSNFSGAVTMTQASAGPYGEIIVFAAGGADTAPGFDGNASVPGSSSSTTSSETTSNANDFVYSVNGLNQATDTAGTGWTIAASANFLLAQYQIVSATGTFTSATATGGATQGSIIDAIKQAAGGATQGLRFNANLDGLSASGGFFRDPLARSMLGWVPGLVTPCRRLWRPAFEGMA